MAPNFFYQGQRDPPKLFPKGVIICHLNHVFGRGSAAKLHGSNKKKCHGTWPKAGEQLLSALEAMILTHSGLILWTAYLCFCLVVKLDGWGSWGPSSSSHTLISGGVSSTAVIATALSHWSFLLEHLGVGHTVPYHYDYILSTSLQLSICILDSKTLG